MEVDEAMKRQFEKCVEKETARSKRRCLIFLAIGISNHFFSNKNLLHRPCYCYYLIVLYKFSAHAASRSIKNNIKGGRAFSNDILLLSVLDSKIIFQVECWWR